MLTDGASSTAIPALAATAAVVLVAVPGTWRLVRPLSTLVHEGGHALVALLTGRRVHAVKLFFRGGGCTTHSGVGTPGQILTAAAGYTAPPLVGLLLAAAVLNDVAAKIVLLAALPLFLVLLRFCRNAFGVTVVLGALAAVVGLLWYSDAETQQLVVVALAGFLLASGIRSVLELMSLVRAGSRSNDAAMLARMTHLPAMVWVMLFLLVAVGCGAVSGRLVVG